jgi:DNA-binding NtrC family response regulator
MNRKLMRAKIRAMLVMDRERRLPLLDALESCGIEVLPVCDCNEARRMLETKPPVQVVITDSALPDGNWRRVLEIVAQECTNIEVVVSLRLGDSTLWLDVLEQGGYDVLVEPYQDEEIRRIVEAAVARSHAEAISYRRMAHRFKRSIVPSGEGGTT